MVGNRDVVPKPFPFGAVSLGDAKRRSGLDLAVPKLPCRPIWVVLQFTPAMEAGLADHVWTLEELIGLLEAKESRVAA